MIMGVEQSASVVFLSAVLVNNLVLESQLALCPLLAGSRKIDVAVGLGLVSAVVMTSAALIGYLLYHYLLVPFELISLKLIILPFVLILLLQSLYWLLKNKSSDLFERYGIFLPLLMLNCSVLSVVLLTLESVKSIWMACVFGLGISVGFGLALILFAGLRERLELADIPEWSQGIPINLISLGILSMAFSGF